MKKILFVCTGNTCRSPMCAEFFKLHGGEKRLGIECCSAGIFTSEGLPASPNAIVAARELGADISTHRSRPLTPRMVEEAAYLVCMTGAQYDQLLHLYPQYENKIFTLAPEDIEDPFGGNIEIYRRTARQIDRATNSIVEKLESQNI